MIANLPLLFANGNPAALSKIGAPELERFITFMVTCSWGHDTAQEIHQPPWWPSDVAFSYPFRRPPDVPRNWADRLKQVVRRCYDYHKSAFLLVFSAQLARYPRRRLRYVNNLDHTTSLYYQPNNKLLVTFRNENLYYDRPNDKKKFFPAPVPQQKSADIYLCDYCDSHFDNLQTLTAHEKLCNNEDLPSSTVSGGLPEFLLALKLRSIEDKPEIVLNKDNEIKPRTMRNTSNLERGPPYPFSSIAYMRNAKSIQRDTTYSRERIERYCTDSSLPNKNTIVSKSRSNSFPVKFKRPIDYWQRKHVFPYQRNKEILDLKGQLMLLKCRPISVKVEQMPLDAMQAYIDNLREEAARKAAEKAIEFVGGFDCDQTMNEERECDPLVRGGDDCEVIDLCSDDEESIVVNENMDPCAGVACVMRGGAVLRRTVARSPQEPLPAEPCGARDNTMSSLSIFHPQPVILFTHSLSNMQTISLD